MSAVEPLVILRRSKRPDVVGLPVAGRGHADTCGLLLKTSRSAFSRSHKSDVSGSLDIRKKSSLLFAQSVMVDVLPYLVRSYIWTEIVAIRVVRLIGEQALTHVKTEFLCELIQMVESAAAIYFHCLQP